MELVELVEEAKLEFGAGDMAERGEKGKILRVNIEYQNVTYTAEGEDAEQWLQWIDKVEFLAAALGRFSNIKWTRIEGHEDEKSSSERH